MGVLGGVERAMFRPRERRGKLQDTVRRGNVRGRADKREFAEHEVRIVVLVTWDTESPISGSHLGIALHTTREGGQEEDGLAPESAASRFVSWVLTGASAGGSVVVTAPESRWVVKLPSTIWD